MKKKDVKISKCKFKRRKNSTCWVRETVSLYVSFKKKMSSLEKKFESFKGGNADGNKRNMKAIQGCWKRMKLQTKKEFDAQ